MKEELLKKNVDLKKYNTFGIGGISKYLYTPNDIKDLIEIIKYNKKNSIKYFIIGLGSNIILPDENFDGMIISLKNFNKIKIDNDICEADAGVSLPLLSNELLKLEYTNFAWASSIPGNIGGSVKGNAGCFGSEIFDDLISVNVLKDDNIITLNKDDIKYKYRETNLNDVIILSAKFNLTKDDLEETNFNLKKWKIFRNENQPYDQKSGGSTFRNPEGYSAGKLIDDLGLKGYSIGGAKVSEKHANFIINYNNASSSDIINLINYIKDKVKEKYDIELILENKIIKWDKL